jgi:GAF domain-containing protein/anti-sigma regulatory factor (Ser/Thr protein kinase)
MAVKNKKSQQRNLTDLTTLEKILEVGQSLIVVRDLELLLRKIARTAGSVLKADVVVLYEYQEETDDIRIPPVVWGKVNDRQVLNERGRKRPHKDSAVFKMLKRTRPFYARNAREDWTRVIEVWSQPKEWSKSFICREGIVSSAAVPLSVNEKKVGVLFVNYRTPRIFHAEERRIIELFANQAAIAIHNADLFAQERQRAADMALLRRVGTTISAALDIKKSLVLIAKGAVQLTRTKATSVIHLFSDTGQRISESYEFPEGFGLISSRFSEKMGLTWNVSNTGQIVEIDDVSHSKRASQALARSNVKSVIGVPLKLKDQVIGALFLNSFKQHRFTDEEKVILTMLAEQAVIAIQNARRLEQEHISRLQAETLREVSTAISSALDLKEVADKILNELGKVVEYRKASMQLIEGDIRTQIAGRGFGKAPSDRLLRPISKDNLIRGIVTSQKPLILSDPSKDPNWEKLHATAGVKSWVGLPLVYRRETIGLLTLDHNQPGFYTPAIKSLLVSFANQAAIAINNARLIQRLSLLQQVGARVSTTLKLDEVLPLLVEGAIRLTKTQSGVVHVLDSAAEQIIGSYGYPEEFSHPSPRLSEEGYTRHIIQKKKQRVVRDTQLDKRANPVIIKKGVRSFVGTPLKLAGEKVVGVLYVNDNSVRQFAEEELSLLRALADQAAIAVENARLFDEAKKRAEGIAFANRLGRALSATRDIEEIPRLLVKGTLKAFNAEAGSLALINAETQEIEFQFALDYKGTRTFEVMKGFKMPLNKGIAGTVVQSRTAVISNNVRDDSRWDREVDGVTGFTTKSILAVPLVYSDRAIGVIEILNKRDGSLFLEREKDVLTTLALSAAIAIENARLYEQRAKDIVALGEVNAAITTGSRENISALIARKAKELTQADYGGLWLVDENRLVLGSMYGASPLEAPELLVDGKSINGWVAKTGKPYKCFNVNTDPHYRIWRREIQSSAAVPLKLRGKVIGTLSVESARPKAFSDYQLKLLQSLADQAAIAIENARLFKETDERATQLEQLQGITRAISAESTDVEKVLHLIVARLSGMFGGASCAIRLLDPSKSEFGERVGIGALKDWWVHHPRSKGTSWYVVKEKTPLYVEHPSVTLPSGQPAIREEAIQKGVKAIAYLPLVSKGDSIGILYVNLTATHRFSENEKRVLELFADQAAIAVENARLYEERSKDIAALQELNEAVVSKELDTILQLAVDKAVEVMPGEYGELWLREPDTGDLILKAVCGPAEQAAQKVGRLKAGVASINMRVAKTGKAGICKDAAKVPGFYRIYPAAQSSATVPLRYRNNVIGTLNVESSRLRAFTEQHTRLLSSLADQAAIALQNATLFQRERQRANALKLLQEVSGKISTALDLNETLCLIVTGAMQLIGMSSGVVHLLDETGQSIVHSFEFPEGFEHPRPRLSKKKSMTRTIIDTGRPIAVPDIAKEGRVNQVMVDRGIQSLIGLPLRLGDRITGVLYLNATQPHRFTEEEQSLLITLSDQAAIAIENARLYAQQTRTNEELQHKVRELEVLPGIYEKIIAVGIKNIGGILDLVYAEASKVMNLSDAQVQFAFYDETKDEVSFPLAIEQDNGQTIDVVRWSKREAIYQKPGEDETVEQLQPRVRREPPGLTEYVIRTKQPILIVKDFAQEADRRGIRVWLTFGRLDRPTHSWLGVPMVIGGRVIGTISVQSLEQEHAFDRGHLELLATVANQAAVAIENARLYQAARGEVIAAKQLATLGTAMAALQHRFNNSFNIIVPNVGRLRRRVDTADETIAEILEIIERNARYTSDIIKRIQEPLREIEIQDVNVNAVVSDAANKVRDRWQADPIYQEIQVTLELDDSIPRIRASTGQVAEVFCNLFDNAFRAMKTGGELKIVSRRADDIMHVRVIDTGPGIPPQIQQRLFEKPVPSKEPGGGAGLGLWLSRLILQSMGGDVTIEQTNSSGTTMLVEIPTAG